MEHVVIALDEDHERAATSIGAAIAAAAGSEIQPAHGHITLATYDGISRVIAYRAIQTAVAGASAFVVRTQGYGFFSGNDGRDLSLHVPVVRSPPLDALHEAVYGALVSAGADVACWTAPSHWSPHITLVEGGLDPDSIGAAAAALASRHHPSWRIPVHDLLLVGNRRDDHTPSTIELSGPVQTASTAELGNDEQSAIITDHPYVAIAETHTGAVLFKGDRAYKFKKPVNFAFDDLSTVSARRRACTQEVMLNRRLAPDVYIGVGELTVPGGTPPEPVVVMRRLPSGRRLATLIRAGIDVTDELDRLAALLARFHADAPRSAVAAWAAGPEATLIRWVANDRELAAAAPCPEDRKASAAVLADARQYLAGRGLLLEQRIADGWARDGHGDLLADDIFCLPDGPRVLDCLEFDERLRVGDVLADSAFLAMDLERLGSPDSGWSFLLAHCRLLGDDWPASLAHHYVAYRAQVRAKVAALRAQQGDASAGEQIGQLLTLAAAHLDVGRVRLVLVGGPPGTGKSTLANALGAQLNAVVLRSDEVRKEIAGVPVGSHASAELDRGIYSDQWNASTYVALLEQARRQLAHGNSVVLDASWSDPRWREQARNLATAALAQLSELRCHSPQAITMDRVARRASHGDDISDADPSLTRSLTQRFASWPSARVVDTTQSPELAAAFACEAVRRRPASESSLATGSASLRPETSGFGHGRRPAS